MMLHDFGPELQALLLGKIRDMGHPAAYLLRVVRTNALRAGNVVPRVADTASLGGLLSREAGLPEVAAHQRIVFGLRQIRFHDLRHTCATLLGKYANPKVVSEMLGPPSVSIILDIYSHLLPDMQE
jgi:integrase